MDFRSLIQSLNTINEDSKVHKGTYGTSYGKEDVRDQYGHKIGKVNKDAEGKKDAPKKGRGRPKKGSDDSGEVKKYDSSALSAALGAGKKPSKEVGKRSVKHSLKEYIEEATIAINEDMNSQDPIEIKPASQTNTQVIQQGNKTLGTVTNPQLAAQIKSSIGKGEMTLAGDEQGMTEDDHEGHDPAEYGMEGDFVKTQLHTIARSTRDLEERISDQEDLPEWVEMKISQAQGMLASVADYMDSQHERDTEHETGEEEMVSEKAKSKAQQRFFGMVHAMQKGKKVPGASSELKGVAKDIGKKDAKDFAKTKHKGLPDHVDETSYEDQGVMDEGRADVGSSTVKSVYYPDKAQSPIKKSQFAYDRQGETNFKKYPDQTSRPAGMNPDPASRYKMGEGEKPHPKELEMIGKTRELGVQNRARDAEQRMANRAAEPKNIMQKVKKDIGGPLSKLAKGDVKGALFQEEEVTENGLQRYTGIKKYGKKGFEALQKAGREGASEEQKGRIKDQYIKKESVEEGKDEGKPGKNFAKIAKDAGKRYGSKAAGERVAGAVRAKLAKQGKLEESTMTQLTENAMKKLLINFYDDVSQHKDDDTMFDLKKAQNVQQAEEVLKALVKHSDEYSHLSLANQNLIVADALRQFAHDPDLPFNKKSKDPFANLDSQRFTNRTPKNMSGYTQHPGAKPGSDFSKPGSPMAIPRTSPATDSSGFLKTLSTPTTFKESNSMKDKQFESWERELNSLLTEGITVSHSTGQQGSPDSLSINATEHDASELMSILRNSGMEMFGGNKEQTDSYGAPEHDGGEFHQGVEVAPSPEVVGDGDDMLALIKKMSGISSDAGTPGSVEVDYEPEGGEESHDETCDDCGHSPCSCDDEEGEEEVGEGYEETDEGAGVMHFKKEQAQKAGQDHFKMGNKEFPVKEDEMEEGAGVMHFKKEQAQKAGQDHFKLGNKEYPVKEGAEDCMECGYPMESCGCDHEQVEETFANDADGDAMGDTELLNLKELLGRGNDLHREKRTQATGNIQKVTMETKLMKDSSELLTDWKKLSGIK
jgi:Protein of unknwon function (DUF3008)